MDSLALLPPVLKIKWRKRYGRLASAEEVECGSTFSADLRGEALNYKKKKAQNVFYGL